ncbi:MAG: SWIM zinc finger family protein [Chroococcidiopsidaceae cyanobacterium CP_BM_ER_R8_30]|nr:SWIM zinc finger family protein [Chroococcidiopsidaceae cyanobacterium CP_BM_ER_R8_30]
MTDYNLQASRQWWAQRWLELLDSYRFKKRLERARNYAREGNVLSIEFKGAKVLAKVQGTEPEPYQVSLSLDPFSDEQWGYVIETMSQRAIFAAKLLAGEMPQNIEEVFTANGLSLFPFTLTDIHSKCSCPDKANPCKHIGAIYYQLGDRFSEDPFVLFQLRGRTKDQIIIALREFRAARVDNLTSPVLSPNASMVNQEEIDASAIMTDGKKKRGSLAINQFWQYNEPLESTLVVIAPQSSETVLDILGPIPLPTSETSNHEVTDSEAVMQYLDTVYKAVSQQAVVLAMNVIGSGASRG